MYKKLFLSFIFSLLAISPTMANGELDSCESEVKRLCQNQTESIKKTLACLKKNHKSLSIQCRKEIERGVKQEVQTKPPAGMLFSGGGGLGGRFSFIPLIKYQGENFGPLGSDDEDKKTRLRRQSVEGSTPIGKIGGGFISTSVRYGVTRFKEDQFLNNGTRVNDKLEQLELGINFNRPLENKKNINIRAQYGYRGDRIGGSDYNYSLMTGYSHPTESGRGRWQYFLMFSNNGPLGSNIPIPGVMYFYRTSTMNLLLGLPVLSFQWTPENTLFSLSLSTFGPFYNLEVNYGLVDQVQYFIFSRWKQENFFLSERRFEEDRLNLYEKVSGVGMRSALMKSSVGLELRAGYSSDRKLYLGDGLFNNDRGSLDLSDTLFLKLMLTKAFR